MKRISYFGIRGSRKAKDYTPFTRSYSLTSAVIGLCLSAPFVIDSILLDHGYHQLTWLPTLFIIGFVVGAPMLLVGLVSFDGRSSNNDSIELQRIRYAAEQEMRKK
jgi:hypothetical protein